MESGSQEITTDLLACQIKRFVNIVGGNTILPGDSGHGKSSVQFPVKIKKPITKTRLKDIFGCIRGDTPDS